MKKWLSIILIPLLVSSLPVLAQTNTQIIVDPTDTPLSITSWTDSGSPFAGNLRLIPQGKEPITFTFLSSDLKRKEGDERIGRQKVTFVGEPKLVNGIPKDFQVQVTGIELPGTYEGQVKLLIAGQPQSQVEIPVQIVAKARPTLTPLGSTNQLQLRLVNCWGFDCSLARFLLGEGAVQDNRQLQFDNSTPTPVSISSIQSVVESNQTGYQLTDAQIKLSKDLKDLNPLSGNQIVSLPITLTRSAMPADHYSGAIYLSIEGRTERLSIPVDLKVRTRPFVPILTLIVGIILGRLFKDWQEQGKDQSKALDEIDRLKSDIDQKAHLDDKQLLNKMLQDVRQEVIRRKLKKEVAEGEFTAITQRMNLLLKIRQMQDSWESMKDRVGEKSSQDITRTIGDAWRLLQNYPRNDEDLTKAYNLITETRQLIQGLGIPMSGGKYSIPELQKVDDLAKNIQDSKIEVMDELVAPDESEKYRNWDRKPRQFIVSLSGVSDELRAEGTRRIVRPLLSIALLSLLLDLPKSPKLRLATSALSPQISRLA